jgi:hypothetical protein
MKSAQYETKGKTSGRGQKETDFVRKCFDMRKERRV